MALQRQQLVSRHCIPHFACSIIASSYEFISRFVESAVGEGQNVRPENLKQEEVTGVVILQLLDQFYLPLY